MASLTQDLPDTTERKNSRWRFGRSQNTAGLHCNTCGVQTHKRNRFSLLRRKLVPLTIENRVLNGRCLLCTEGPMENEIAEPDTGTTHGREDDINFETDRLVASLAGLGLLLTILVDDEENTVNDVESHVGIEEICEESLAGDVVENDEEKPNTTDDEMKESLDPTKCSICLCGEEDFSSKEENCVATIDGCRHRFCFECIKEWSAHENTCPLCKTRFTRISTLRKHSSMSDTTEIVPRRDQRPADDDLVPTFIADALREILVQLLMVAEEEDSDDDDDSVAAQRAWEDYFGP